MNYIKKLILVMGLLGCAGGPGQDENYHDPVRIDGSPETDRSFINQWEEDNWCSQNPDAIICSRGTEVGVARQPWTSAMYHGLDRGTTHPSGELASPSCYSNEDNGGSSTTCDFPWLKQVNVTFDDSACWNMTPGTGQPPYSALEVQEFIDAVKLGISKWNGAGTNVTVTVNGSNQGKMPVLAICEYISGGPIATASLVSNDWAWASTSSQTPVASNGEDRGFFKKIKGGLIRFDMRKMKNGYANCDQSSPTTAERKVFFSSTSEHEMGHIMGFGHFKASGNVMHPAACPNGPPQSIPAIAQAFKDALTIFNSTDGNATIQDTGLGALDPN